MLDPDSEGKENALYIIIGICGIILFFLINGAQADLGKANMAARAGNYGSAHDYINSANTQSGLAFFCLIIIISCTIYAIYLRTCCKGSNIPKGKYKPLQKKSNIMSKKDYHFTKTEHKPLQEKPIDQLPRTCPHCEHIEQNPHRTKCSSCFGRLDK